MISPMARMLKTWIGISMVLFGFDAARGAAEPEAASRSIRVEIFEGIPNETNWNFAASAPSETYSESAFGFWNCRHELARKLNSPPQHDRRTLAASHAREEIHDNANFDPS